MKLDEIKRKVFTEKPVFASFYERYGQKTWPEYLAETFPIKKNLTKENLELVDRVESHVAALLGKEKAAIARKTLEENFFASTAEHHGVLNHPFFLNSALARSQSNRNVLVLAFGGISLSNSSFPRGMAFHDENLEQIQVPFISHKYRSEPLYSHKALTRENLSEWCDKLFSKFGDRQPARLKQVREIFLGQDFGWGTAQEKEVSVGVVDENLFKLQTASEQFTVLNNRLWKNLFGNSRGELFYIEIETLAAALLTENHFGKGTIIEKMIFDGRCRRAHVENFDGIDGAHDSAKQKGSHLFWYIDTEKNERKQLFAHGDFLETLDGLRVDLNHENIKKLLAEKKLLPTMALTFSVVSFYHGLACGGGFSQVGYLGEMKRAYEKVLASSGDKRLAVATDLRTDIFSGEFVLATIQKGEKNVSATFLDLFLYSEGDLSKKLDELLSKVTIKDTIDLMMPELHKIITGGHEKVEVTDLPKTPALLAAAPGASDPKKVLKCPYCGNNQVNHVNNFLMTSLEIPFKPLIVLGMVAERSPLRFLADIATVLSHFLLHACGLLRFNKEKTKAASKRSEVIWEEAERRGIPMEQFVILGKPIEYYRAKINGKWEGFESLPVPEAHRARSYEWMDDKIKLKEKFMQEKVPVARGGSVWDSKKALDVFRNIEKPVITKPRLGSRGRHTTTYIHTEEDLIKAYKIAKQLGLFVVVEEHLVGSVYRATYVGGEIAGILRGDPPRITGTGTHTIQELIEMKNAARPKGVKEVLITPLLVEFLTRVGWRLTDILPVSQVIDLSEKIGISYGGFSAEELPKAHPKLIAHLKRAGDILNAPLVGFDFIVADVTADPDTQKWGIIEANSLPFINLHHFPLEGEPINVAAKVWDLWR